MTTDVETDSQEARLARRTADLYARDQQFSDAKPLAAVTAAITQPGMRLAQIVATVLEGYADRPALGQRAHELTTDSATGRTTRHLLPRFETVTYRELDKRMGDVASAWHHDVDRPLSAGDFVAIMGFTSTDYTVLDLACIHLGAVSVPLQTSAAPTQLKPIIAETEPRILAASIDFLDNAVECVLTGFTPQRLVVFDYVSQDDDQRDAFESARKRLADAGSPVIVESLAAIIERGSTLAGAPMFLADAGDDPLLTLFYTSGSTGSPKGAMYPESTFSRAWLRPMESQLEPSRADLPSICLNYMPMSHVYGRAWLFTTLARGGIGYFAAKSDMSTLFDDLALVRPTSLNLVPRVCDMIFQRYQSEIDRRGSDRADEIKAEIREQFLGGRYLSASCGTAPMSAEMTAFIESLLDVPLMNGYGSTEAGGIIIDGHVSRPPVIDYKLVDVPELGYFLTDKPYPRGELLVQSADITPGYYKRPDVTAAMFDEDGYYKTGDVMAETGPDQLAYVDRRNNVLKLSQGEFVAVSHLESVFASSPYIRQIYVYGSSERAFLLAVIVPNTDALPAEGADFTAVISESLQQIAKDTDLNSYEVPRDFLIENEPYSLENGLLTGIAKLARPVLKAHYGQRLEQLYTDIAQGQVDELRALRTASRDMPVLETVSRAAQATLGCTTADLSPTAMFTDLGGDSLSALSFSTLLEEIFDVEVPVNVVISPTSDLQRLADYIEAERNSSSKRPTVVTVHGRNLSAVHADELTLDKFIDATTLTDAPALPQPSGAVKTVLMTGASGFLGRFLCLDWLERLAKTNGTLICIGRGSDASAARERIETALGGDEELTQHFKALADRHLEVLAGDIGEPDLGLDEATWRRLAGSVDMIVHPAALVNHLLPYTQLFGPNVVGTAELIRLAITTKLKPFSYISTVAAAVLGEDKVVDEDADIRVASPSRPIDNSYASGYATSKWAGEVLMREAHDLCGLAVAVFRSDMILAHSRYATQLNVPDMFTRLMLSLVATGVAPRSFYVSDARGTRPRAHYDGLPVDFTAEAIATLGGQATDGFHTYNVMNPHHDGISLDQFVDWLIDAGHPIQRIDDYADWFSRFETVMRGLPELQRQHSLLALLDAFRHPAEPVPGSTVPSDRFRGGVQAAAIGPDHDIPHLSSALIDKYINDLQQLELL